MAPCLEGSPSGLALEGFVGGTMGTAAALRVLSCGPVGIGTLCDVSSSSHYICDGTGTKIGSISSSSTGGIWGLMSPSPCLGIRRLGDPDLSTLGSAGWLLRWQMPSSRGWGLCVPMTTVVELQLVGGNRGRRLASCRRSICGELGR